MNFSRLKELVRKLGGVLVLDGDKPEFVILSYDNYQKMEIGEEIPFFTNRNERDGIAEMNGEMRNIVDVDEDQKTVERLNQEISALKEEIRQKEEAELIENEQSTEPMAQAIDLD